MWEALQEMFHNHVSDGGTREPAPDTNGAKETKRRKEGNETKDPEDTKETIGTKETIETKEPKHTTATKRTKGNNAKKVVGLEWAVPVSRSQHAAMNVVCLTIPKTILQSLNGSYDALTNKLNEGLSHCQQKRAQREQREQ